MIFKQYLWEIARGWNFRKLVFMHISELWRLNEECDERARFGEDQADLGLDREKGFPLLFRPALKGLALNLIIFVIKLYCLGKGDIYILGNGIGETNIILGETGV